MGDNKLDIEIPLSRKVATWKRPIDVFVPHSKESKLDLKDKEGKEQGKEGKDSAHHPPFCIVSPLVPSSASVGSGSGSMARSPSPSSFQRVSIQLEASHAKLEVPGIHKFVISNRLSVNINNIL